MVYGGVDVVTHVFLASILIGDEWSDSRLGRLTSGERTLSTQWIRGWMGPIVGLGDMEKKKFLPLPGVALWPLGRPARSQSVYRLRYPGIRL
jgi:hypothetical protein